MSTTDLLGQLDSLNEPQLRRRRVEHLTQRKLGDFVVCLSHVPGDALTARLVETKENVKDAARKARRVPRSYGKVLFLAKEVSTNGHSHLRIVNDDGSRGLTVDWDDLMPVRERFRNTRPMPDHGLDQRVSR